MSKKTNAGGYRAGSGRPKGTGKYKELTQPIRVPVSLIPQIEELLAHKATQDTISVFDNIYPYPKPQEKAVDTFSIPFYASRVAAGFPSPADDHVENHLDLNQHLVQRPSATFFVRVEGDSMINVGIHEDDILIVDRSIEPTNGRIVIAAVNGELTVKRLEIQQKRLRLLPENPRYSPLEITEEIEFTIWGVVVHVIHSL